MTEKDDGIAEMADRARKYAAMSVVFDPVDAIKASFGKERYDPPVAARIMGFLRADCTTAVDGEGWIMRQSPRDRVLEKLGREGLQDLAGWNLPDDPLATTMRAVLTADPETTASEIETLLNDPTPDIERVDVMARVLELAGSATGEVYEKLPALQGTLNRHSAIRRAEEQLAQGYFGNEALRDRLGSWIDNPSETGLARALYIRGIPGVGKSFLLTKLVQEARERSNPVVLWLDFDRRGLNLVEPDGLTMELARQLGNELPESAIELAQLRAQDSGVSSQYSSKRGQRSLSFALVQAMGEAVHASGRHVLLVLDTLEVLASYGDTHPHRLFEFLDDLLGLGVSPMAIVAAGRGEALATLGKNRVEDVLLLAGLPERVARTMLDTLGTPKEAVEPILRIAHGNPLILRLAAKLAREGGAEAIEIENMQGEPPEVAGGYLYRAILSRIEGDDLCEIANLGLVMERVDAGAIAEVIAPALGMEVSREESDRLLERLSTHHWLVEAEPGGWVRHRSDVRQVVLKLLYADRREQVAAINRAAARYLADRDPVAALYHQLQTVGPRDTIPAIDPALAAQFTDTMIDELPDRSADAVLQARGERSRSGRRKSASPPVEEQPPASLGRVGENTAVTREGGIDHEITLTDQVDMRNLLLKGDIVEADALYRAKFSHVEDPASNEGLAALCLCWLSGRWSRALRFFRQLEATDFDSVAWVRSREPHPRRALEAAGFGPGANQDTLALLRLVLLEMRAEFSFDALVAEFERDTELLRYAQLTYRDAKTLRLTEGALAYALLAENRPTTISGGWREAVGSAGTGLRDKASQDFCLRDATVLRGRHGIPVDFADSPPWDVAACLNPYSAPVAMLVSLRLSPKLDTYLGAVSARFGAMARMPFGVDEGNVFGSRLPGRPEVHVEQLGALGATADWLSAFAFFNQVANVPLVARRAELWRRCAAGQWAYGSNAPEGWYEPEFGLDRGTQAWLERLASGPEPAEEAARQLLFWHDPASEDKGAIAPMGKRGAARLARALRQAKRAARRAARDPHLAAARALVARHVGRSIAVPIAVLAAEARDSAAQGHWLELLARSGGSEVKRVLREE